MMRTQSPKREHGGPKLSRVSFPLITYGISSLGRFSASKQDSGSVLALDVQALSAFRILFCLYLFVDFIINICPWYDDLYGAAGILPLGTLAAHDDFPGLQAVLPLVAIFQGLRISAILPALYGAALLAFAVGFRTRLANVFAFILNSYLYWRNPYLKSGAEDLAHLLLLWCLFLPMSRYWSVDSALDPQPPDRPYPALPFIAIRLQIASLYLFAAFFKLAGAPWRSGDAVIWALSDTAFGATPIALFLVHHVPMMLRVVNYLVIAFQLAFPFLIYCPWHNTWTRGFGLTGAALMHLSFMFCLNIGGFPFLSLISLVLLVPDVWIDRLFQRRRTQLERIAIYYDPDCGFCRRVSLVVRAFLLTRAAKVLPASDDPEAFRLLQQYQSWVVRRADGGIVLKWAAFAYLLKQNFIFSPLGWLSDVSFVRRPMDRFYDFIGAHRKQLGGVAKQLMPDRNHDPIGVPAVALCGLLSSLALADNVSNLINDSGSAVSRVSAAFQVRQNWALFAPVPTYQSWNYTIVVIEQDGTMADLMRPLHPPLIATSSGKVTAASRAWLKYFTRFMAFDVGDWTALGRYLCEKSQHGIGPSSAVVGINVKVTISPVSAASDSGKNRGHEQQFQCVGGAS
jgi:hypothetical protein